VTAGVIASVVIVFPTGDMHGKYVARNQPAAMAGMEGQFKTESGAGMVLIGSPTKKPARSTTHRGQRPAQLSHLRNNQGGGEGLDQFPPDERPTALPLLFYAYHIMAGLGTWFVLLMVVAAVLLWTGGFTHRAGHCGRCCSAFRCPTLPILPAG